jgi:hypothetical protein
MQGFGVQEVHLRAPAQLPRSGCPGPAAPPWLPRSGCLGPAAPRWLPLPPRAGKRGPRPAAPSPGRFDPSQNRDQSLYIPAEEFSLKRKQRPAKGLRARSNQ